MQRQPFATTIDECHRLCAYNRFFSEPTHFCEFYKVVLATSGTRSVKLLLFYTTTLTCPVSAAARAHAKGSLHMHQPLLSRKNSLSVKNANSTQIINHSNKRYMCTNYTCCIIHVTRQTSQNSKMAVKKSRSSSRGGIGDGGVFLVTMAGKFNYFAFDSWKFRP